ncbi:hypothetical protein [Dokdonia sp. Hel_I_53]|uniref:hypothetical protein n=1 Tax=Dokdonia sp. Hel_I_53 TaxID=1566287 RepID=UPI0011996CD7|nr:hypothetical protein [Dokdonia sp. Hel_I_53]TVZ52056.1 outer membrane translocation and assembly module TamA [Dokdonia sp. Hel_I_53]
MKFYILLFILVVSTKTILSQEADHILTLTLQGNTLQETAQIKEIAALRKSYNSFINLKEGFESIGKDLNTIGYVDHTKKLAQKNDSLYIATISLGILYDKITLQVPQDLQLRKILSKSILNIKNDSVLVETAFAKAHLKNLSIIAANSGIPFSEFKIINIQKNKANKLAGKLLFTPQQKRTVNKLIINDYNSIRNSFLKHKAGFRKNEVFSRDQLIAQSNLLASLPFVTENKKPEVLFTTDSTNVFFYISKKNANSFDGLLSFNNGENNRLKLNGYLDLSLVNNFNYGESIFVQYRADGNDQSQLSATINLPYIFNAPIGFETGLNIFRKDSTFSNTSTVLTILYENLRNSTFSASTKYTESDNLISEDNNDTIANFTKNSFSLGYNFKNIQTSNLFPVKSYVEIKTGYGKRKSQKKSISQYHIELIASHIFNLNDRNHLFLENQTSYLRSSNYLINELYTLGGINSIRGFRQNSIFANWYTTFKSEYRLLLNSNLFINTILDVNYFENKTSNTNSILTAIGFGSGINTKAGLLKISFANGKFGKDKFQFTNTTIAITIKTAF